MGEKSIDSQGEGRSASTPGRAGVGTPGRGVRTPMRGVRTPERGVRTHGVLTAPGIGGGAF